MTLSANSPRAAGRAAAPEADATTGPTPRPGRPAHPVPPGAAAPAADPAAPGTTPAPVPAPERAAPTGQTATSEQVATAERTAPTGSATAPEQTAPAGQAAAADPQQADPQQADPPRAEAAVAKRGGRRARTTVLTFALAAALFVLCLVAAGTGAYDIPLGDVVSSALHRMHLGGSALDRVGESVLWNVRLPRVVLALLVGASLGCAGALMQGGFGNPLAEPGVIGISAGAAVGAVGSIALGLTFLGDWTVTACAFASGLLTVLLVYVLSRSDGKTEVVTLILTGIAVNAFAGALIGLFIFFADNAQITQITFWQLGSLSQATWPKVLAVLPCALAGLFLAPFYARQLDLLALGERPARHLGVDVERLRVTVVVLVALLTAAAVAVAGIITFVGLLVPHLLRMAAGPGHRFLVPGSALGGAVVLVAADLAARTVAQPAELPLGVLTALFGSPFFFWLLRRTRRKQGGWA